MDRRKFLSSLGRGSILAGLASLSGVLIYRKSKINEPCNFNFICNDCRELKYCKQPEAILFKRKKAKQKLQSNG